MNIENARAAPKQEVSRRRAPSQEKRIRTVVSGQEYVDSILNDPQEQQRLKEKYKTNDSNELLDGLYRELAAEANALNGGVNSTFETGDESVAELGPKAKLLAQEEERFRAHEEKMTSLKSRVYEAEAGFATAIDMDSKVIESKRGEPAFKKLLKEQEEGEIITEMAKGGLAALKAAAEAEAKLTPIQAPKATAINRTLSATERNRRLAQIQNATDYIEMFKVVNQDGSETRQYEDRTYDLDKKGKKKLVVASPKRKLEAPLEPEPIAEIPEIEKLKADSEKKKQTPEPTGIEDETVRMRNNAVATPADEQKKKSLLERLHGAPKPESKAKSEIKPEAKPVPAEKKEAEGASAQFERADAALRSSLRTALSKRRLFGGPKPEAVEAFRRDANTFIDRYADLVAPPTQTGGKIALTNEKMANDLAERFSRLFLEATKDLKREDIEGIGKLTGDDRSEHFKSDLVRQMSPSLALKMAPSHKGEQREFAHKLFDEYLDRLQDSRGFFDVHDNTKTVYPLLRSYARMLPQLKRKRKRGEG